MMKSRHPRSRTSLSRTVALLATAALITACGGDDDDTADIDITTVPDTTMAETTEPDTTMSDTTMPDTTMPETTDAVTTEPGTTEPDMTEPTEPDTTTGDTTSPTSDNGGQGVDCATSEQGDPLDPQALAEMDPATALGNIDGASTFLFIATEADLIDRLESDDELTFFVPTDDAFDMIPEDELEELLTNPLDLTSLVQAHIVNGVYTSADLVDGTTLPTAIEGQEWLVDVSDDGQIMVAGSSTVVCADIETSNAVVHLVDQVIITPAGIG